MQKRVFCCFILSLLSAAPSAAVADAPSIGVDLNVVVGRQRQSSQNSTSLPTIPVPMFSVRIPVKRFAIFAEGVPPIGPVSYRDGNGSTQATKINYMLAEARYRLPGDRFAAGIGTTLVNQATFYNRPFVMVTEQSSRVAGFRFSLLAKLENRLNATTEVSIGISPSMHGLQYSHFRFPFEKCPVAPIGPGFVGYVQTGPCTAVHGVDDAEYASLVDLRATRGQRFGRYTLRYGLRYINYSARFPDGWAADRERLIMPFAGVEVPLR